MNRLLKGTSSETKHRAQAQETSAQSMDVQTQHSAQKHDSHTSVHMLSPHQANLSSCQMLLSATSVNIVQAVEDFTSHHGGPLQAAVALQHYQVPDPNAQKVGTVLGLAYLIEHPGHPELLIKFVQAAGNMLALFDADPSRFGQFITRHPQAIEAVPHWTRQLQNPQQGLQMVADCAKLISTKLNQVTAEELGDALQLPTNQAQVAARLLSLAASNQLPQENAARLSTLAAAVGTADQPEEVLQLIKDGGWNLYLVLTASHLGKAMQMGLISVAQLQQWATPSQHSFASQKLTQGSSGPTLATPAAGSCPTVARGAYHVANVQSNKRKGAQTLQIGDYLDLRTLCPPVDPAIQSNLMHAKLLNPLSPPGTPILRFEPEEMHDHRLRAWYWWQHVSQIGICVQEMYSFTPWQGSINAVAAGNQGQLVIKTAAGTITWIPSDRRITISNSSKSLQTKLEAICMPWDKDRDMSQKYHRGRVPNQIQSALAQTGTPITPPLFQ